MVQFGGMVRNVKRRETRCYQIAVAGSKKVSIFALDPYEGRLTKKDIQMGSVVRNFSCLAFSRVSATNILETLTMITLLAQTLALPSG